MTNATVTTTKFETGKTYRMPWIYDSELFNDITIERRTAKSVWIKCIYTCIVVRKSITILNNVETIRPTPAYSMAPRLYADSLAP